MNATRELQERLPFTVRAVRSGADLQKAVKIRHSAYDRHIPLVAAQLVCAEDADFADGAVVFLAESRLDGEALGTIRIQTNRYNPLPLEQSVALPPRFLNQTLAEATRLGVVNNRTGRLVKVALFKAFYEYCRLTGVDHMVIAARSPLDRQYTDHMFEDVFPGGGFIPMRHAGNIPHRVLSLSVTNAAQIWTDAQHPMCDFFLHTTHTEIDVSDGARAVKHLRLDCELFA